MHKDFQLHRGLWRVFYWGTVIPLVLLLLHVYYQNKDQEKIILRSQQIFNRQLELISDSHQQHIDRLNKK